MYCVIRLKNVLLVMIVMYASAEEPVCGCPQLHSLEHLLEKLVRMEIKFEQLEKQQCNGNNTPARVDNPIIGFSAYSPFLKGLATDEILILQAVALNAGEGYDNSKGIFTAPESGLYQFSVHVCNQIGKYVHYAIVHGDKQLVMSEQRDEDINTCSSVSSLAIVHKGEKVFVRITAGYTSGDQLIDDIYRRTTFEGVLLHKLV